eukprot:jgi/Sobl393_1/14073/SZX67297.1
MHNNRQFALKFYASNEDFMAEMMAYKELGGPSSKFVPVLEMTYPGSSSYPTSPSSKFVPVLEMTYPGSSSYPTSPSSKFVPVLEMSYPGSSSYPTSVLVFERGQCTLETFARQRPSYFQQVCCPSSKFVPVLEMSYPGSSSYPTSVLVFERGQCTLETFARQRPSYFQQIDIFHQLVSAVQHLHEHGTVHRDLKPSNVVHFPEKFAWKLIDLATVARIGQETKVIDIFHQLVSAVQHLHEHGTVHRDLKPSNVVHFPEKFAWKLIDLATVARIGQETKVVYTREYVSPEVAQAVVGGAVSIIAEPSWDLWGIGIIMWELATGQRYFPPEWSMDGGRRMWSALCGFEPLPHELIDISTMRGPEVVEM